MSPNIIAAKINIDELRKMLREIMFGDSTRKYPVINYLNEK